MLTLNDSKEGQDLMRDQRVEMKSTLFGDAEVSVEPWKWVSAIWQLITLHLKMCVNHTTSSKSGLLSTTRSIYELKFLSFLCILLL
jgi:hypothetical protein